MDGRASLLVGISSLTYQVDSGGILHTPSRCRSVYVVCCLPIRAVDVISTDLIDKVCVSKIDMDQVLSWVDLGFITLE